MFSVHIEISVLAEMLANVAKVLQLAAWQKARKKELAEDM